MHKVSAKRQITIPKELCNKLNIGPGDLVEVFEYEGRVTIIKKDLGASAGMLRRLKGDASVTDEESLQDALAQRHPRKRKTNAA